LPLLISNQPIGKRVKIDLIRNSTLKTIVVQVGEQKDEVDDEPKSERAAPKEDPLGLSTQNMSREIAQSLGLGLNQKGVFVTSVEAGSTAASKGVRRGDVIVEVNRKNIDTVEQYNESVANLKKGNSVLLLIVRKQGTIFIAFEL